MSNTSNTVTYNCNIAVGDSGGYNTQIFLYSQSGIDDAFVLNLGTSLQAMPWPSGSTITITKTDINETDYNANLTTTPAAFS